MKSTVVIKMDIQVQQTLVVHSSYNPEKYCKIWGFHHVVAAVFTCPGC